MFLNRIELAICAAASAMTMVSCARSSDSVPSQSRELSISDQTAAANRYDPSSLTEVTKIANLPESLRPHFKGWMEPGDTNGSVPYRFIVAGASNTSALVAFEEFGYVPSTHAISYVHVNDGWVAAQTWDGVGYPTSLAELKNTISQFVLPASGH